MQNSYSESYKAAGVDVTSGYRAVELIKKHVQRTKVPGVVEGIGGFGGLFDLSPFSNIKEPVLVSGTDGVGTKLKIAMLLDKHDTIGIDCVAMCVNDIICSGAKPLFFLDYLAVGKNVPEKIEQIVSGVAEGCVLAECALVGGETAEHPGVMPIDDYDIAGFAVGIAEKSAIPNKKNVKQGDVIIGVASNGVHSNGFSLTRKVFGIDTDKKILDKHFTELGKTLGEELLIPTKIYVKPVLELFKKNLVKAVSHITGGGFYENIPRVLGENTSAIVEKNALQEPAIFQLIAKTGNIPQRDMYNTYNMGIGLCIITAAENADETLRILHSFSLGASVIGEICKGDFGLEIK